MSETDHDDDVVWTVDETGTLLRHNQRDSSSGTCTRPFALSIGSAYVVTDKQTDSAAETQNKKALDCINYPAGVTMLAAGTTGLAFASLLIAKALATALAATAAASALSGVGVPVAVAAGLAALAILAVVAIIRFCVMKKMMKALEAKPRNRFFSDRDSDGSPANDEGLGGDDFLIPA